MKPWTTIGVALLFGVGVASAEVPTETMPSEGVPAENMPSEGLAPDFGSLDADADGAITKEEAKTDAELSGQFDQLDANADGKLDSSELEASAAGSAEPEEEEAE